MSSKNLNIQQKFSVEAKAAYERLIIQTLWGTHPLSFYHSASQEIVGLIRYLLRKASPEFNEQDKLSLKWTKDLPVSSQHESNVVIDYHESNELSGNLDKFFDLSLTCKLSESEEKKKTESPWTFNLKLNKKYLHCESFLKALLDVFLQDLYTFKSNYSNAMIADNISIQSFENIVTQVTNMINDVFNNITTNQIHSQIMLYYPETSSQDGYLFYHDEKPEKEGNTNYDATYAVIVNDYITEEKKRNSSSEIGSDKFSTTYKEIYDYYKKVAEKCDKFKKLPDEKVLYKSYLLRHPADFFKAAFKIQLSNCTACSDKCNRPLCYQAKGLGPAGAVAKQGITFVIQDVVQEDSFSLEEIWKANVAKDDRTAYALMHIIEQGYSIPLDRRAIVTPLYGKGQLIGILYATKKKEENNYFTSHEIELFESLAHKAGSILQEVRDYKFYEKLVQSKISAESEARSLNSLKDDVAKNIVLTIKENMRLVLNVYEGIYDIPCDDCPPFVTLESISCDYNKSFRLLLEITKDEALTNKIGIKKQGHFIHLLCLNLPFVDSVPVKGNNNKGFKIYMIQEDHKDIFNVHREKLEIFFSYCWGLAGYIAPVTIPQTNIEEKSASQTDEPIVPLTEGF